MKKQLLILVMALLPMVASADAVEIDGIYYNLVKKVKTAEVTKNPNGYKGEVNIPPSVTYEDVTYDVTSIGSNAFSWNPITSISIPNSVTSIGSEAFTSSSLTSVHITDIAAWCKISFADSYSNPLSSARHLYMNGSEITQLVIPNGVTSIGDYAFYDCSGLTSVTIPNSVTSIGNYAFWYCYGLTSVTIPNSVTSIGNYAFSLCYNLISVTNSNSVTSIGVSAFSGCSSLTSVHITDIAAWCKISFADSYSNPLSSARHLYMNGSEITQLVIPNGVTSIGDYAFYDCSGLTSISIPNSVTSTGKYAFYNCSKLESLSIGSGVNSIGDQAFASCPELSDVYCYAENVPKTQGDAFNGSYVEYATLHVPDASVTSYAQTAPWSGFKNVVGLSGTSPEKCATPTITIDNGKLTFKCETEGVSFNASYSYNSGNGNVVGEELVLAGTTTAHVSVYATKDGYLDSEVATVDVELCVGKKGDVNQDGVVSISDAVGVVNIILNGGDAQAAPALKQQPEASEAE